MALETRVGKLEAVKNKRGRMILDKMIAAITPLEKRLFEKAMQADLDGALEEELAVKADKVWEKMTAALEPGELKILFSTLEGKCF
jgi:hypothetical protein